MYRQKGWCWSLPAHHTAALWPDEVLWTGMSASAGVMHRPVWLALLPGLACPEVVPAWPDRVMQSAALRVKWGDAVQLDPSRASNQLSLINDFRGISGAPEGNVAWVEMEDRWTPASTPRHLAKASCPGQCSYGVAEVPVQLANIRLW